MSGYVLYSEPLESIQSRSGWPHLQRCRASAENLRKEIQKCVDSGIEPRFGTRSRLLLLERHIAKAEGATNGQ